MVDTRGRLPLPETPLEYPAIAFLYLIVIGGGLAALIAVSALIAPLLPDWVPVFAAHPSTAAIYAEIAAGLSMPVLAVLTYWYASETRKLAEEQEQMHQREIRKDEARIEAFLTSLVDEINSHPSNFDEIDHGEYSFPTERYDEGLELIQQLEVSERRAIHRYYFLVK